MFCNCGRSKTFRFLNNKEEENVIGFSTPLQNLEAGARRIVIREASVRPVCRNTNFAAVR
jgi:hypothetical protein